MEAIWSIVNAFLYPFILVIKFISALLIICYFLIGAYFAYKCHTIWHEVIMEPEEYPRLRWIFFPLKTFRNQFGIAGNWYGEDKPDFYVFLILCTFLWPIKIFVGLCLAPILYMIHKHQPHKE